MPLGGNGGMAVFSKCPYIERGMEKPWTGLRVSVNSWQLKFWTILARPLKLFLGILSSYLMIRHPLKLFITWHVKMWKLPDFNIIVFFCLFCVHGSSVLAAKNFCDMYYFFVLECQRVNSRLAPKSTSSYIASLSQCTLRMGNRKYFFDLWLEAKQLGAC